MKKTAPKTTAKKRIPIWKLENYAVITVDGDTVHLDCDFYQNEEPDGRDDAVSGSAYTSFCECSKTDSRLPTDFYACFEDTIDEPPGPDFLSLSYKEANEELLSHQMVAPADIPTLADGTYTVKFR